MEPRTGWEEGGIYRRAHNKAIKKASISWLTSLEEESDAYEKAFQKEVNKIISRGEKYEALKAKGREDRRLAREERVAKFKKEEEEAIVKKAFEHKVSAMIDSELEHFLKLEEAKQSDFIDQREDFWDYNVLRFKNSQKNKKLGEQKCES